MTRLNRINYLDGREYLAMMEQATLATYEALADAARHCDEDTDEFDVIQNLLIRSAGLLECIVGLSLQGYHRNALSLYRMLVERVLYLNNIVQESGYTAFKRWSIAKQYQALDQMYGLKDVRVKVEPEWIDQSKKAQAERRRLFGGRPPSRPECYWTPPNLKEFAKEQGLSNWYLIAYAYPSASAVHPTHDEGVEPDTDQLVVCHNGLGTYCRIAAIGLYQLTGTVPPCFVEINQRLATALPDNRSSD